MSGLGKSGPDDLRSGSSRAVLTFQKTHQPAAKPARIDDANRTGLAAALVRRCTQICKGARSLRIDLSAIRAGKMHCLLRRTGDSERYQRRD